MKPEETEETDDRKRQMANLVELSLHPVWMKLIKKVPELQGINCHDLCASPLPVISGTNKRNGFLTFSYATKKLSFGQRGKKFSYKT